jgi:hypothetical protein
VARRGLSPELSAVSALVLVGLAQGGASGPHPWDVGELAAAAARLGGSHAPGQPLHALLAHAAGWLPLGSFVLRLSWLSSLGAAWAAYASGRAVHALLDRYDASARVAAVSAALAVALSPAVLRSAMRPEVYALALACVTSSAWALAARARGDGHGLRVTAILAGLAFALHPPHALAIAAMGLVACFAKPPSRVELGSSIGLGLVVTFALMAYLPLRAAAGAPMWGDPTSASGLWAYVSGASFRRNLGSGQDDAIAVARYLVLEGGGAAVLVCALAIRDRALRWAWALALVAIVAAVLQPFEERNPDNVAYDAPALALVFVAAAASLARLSEVHARWTSALVAIAPLSVSLVFGHLVSAELPALETLAFETASAPGPRALLVTRTDFLAASVMLEQDVDRLRPDLAHFVEGLATSSWHWRSLAGHPAFDGAPHRGPGRDPREAYVLGAIGRAHGLVEVDVENAALLEEHGSMRGALLALGESGVDERAMAERTMGAIASSLSWRSLGDHEAGAQIVRDVILRRAPLLAARGYTGVARAELRMAAPEAADAIALLRDARPALPPALLVHDASHFMAARGDVVRAIAVMLDQQGRPADATRLLQQQNEGGDDLALAQLAALQLNDGLVREARETLAAYRQRHPEDRSPDLDALSAALAP